MENITFHAKVRFRQRGILEDTIRVLMQHGEKHSAPDGAHKVILSARNAGEAIGQLKRQIHWIEKASKIVLIEKEGVVLTGYHKKS